MFCGRAQAAKPLALRRAESARDQVRSLRSVLDLERVRPSVRSVMDDQALLGIFAADLVVDLSRRRGGPRPELDQERIGLRVVQDGLAIHGLNLGSRKALCAVAAILISEAERVSQPTNSLVF